MSRVVAEMTPRTAGWDLITAHVIDLQPGETYEVLSETDESAIVVVQGHVEAEVVGGATTSIRRDDVFSELAALVYTPPGRPVLIHAHLPTQVAIGQAPAEGRHPPLIIEPSEMAGVIRGGGPARRQVMSALAEPLPAERLIVYEGWVPRGSWTGWPPHRHDGFAGSPRLEETYYFRFDRPNGFGFHRNYAPEQQWEESFLLRDQAMVAVPRGYHLCGNGPAANMWLLNFLAGPPEDRASPPYVDPDETWIQSDWTAGAMTLPAVSHPSLA